MTPNDSLFGPPETLTIGTHSALALLDGTSIALDLNIGPEPSSPALLSQLITHARDLRSLDTVARQALLAAVSDAGSSASLYASHHREELSPDELRSLFGSCDEKALANGSIVNALRLVRVGIYPSGRNPRILLDYSLSPELTQYVLCVAVDKNGAVLAIDIES